MRKLPLEKPPASICLLRLSAIGDVTHMLPLIATLQSQWPGTKLTWIIGSTEFQLVKSLADIEFIVFDKRNGFTEFLKLLKQLKARRFDLMLMMQVALRANLLSLMIPADIKLGYDRQRTRDFHQLFCNYAIDGPARVHVLDTFFQFVEKLGIAERKMDWLLKADEAARAFALNHVDAHSIVINPCSSVRANNWRNWPVENYVDLIDRLMKAGRKVILTGGPSDLERQFCQSIGDACEQPPQNLVGKTSLIQLLALLEGAGLLIAPDTGPAHMGTVAGIPVVGLFASSNPLRTGPYNSLDIVVNAYPDALQKYNGKTVGEAGWGERVRDPEVMKMITVDAVIERVESCL